MRLPCFRCIRVLLQLVIWPLSAGAADVGAATSCSRLDDSVERLACYDAIFDRPVVTTEAALAATAMPKGTVIPELAAQTSPEADFGLSAAARQARDAEGREVIPLRSISTTVVALEQSAAVGFIATLDNGQVWGQSAGEPTVRLRVNDTVTVRRAALGSYLLVTPNRVATRVRRIR